MNARALPSLRAETGSAAADPLQAAIDRARARILSAQRAEGCWCHELEADCTIPAEYVLMLHYFGEREPLLERRIGAYLRRRQNPDGGWPLYEAGASDVSCSVKAYFALKLIGDGHQAPHMRRARAAILGLGGAARANVFTRITLALFGELPWRGTPWVPVEVVLLPRWFPFHLSRVSYWSRTVVTPLAVLCSLKPRAKNPLGVSVRELFVTPPEAEKHYFPSPKSFLARLFLWLDAFGRTIEPHMPKRLRARALQRAKEWIVARLNGEYGLGAIFPAMVNAAEALPLLGFAEDDRHCRQARKALRDLLVTHDGEAYCQPCTSTVWDTGLTCLALQEDLRGAGLPALEHALEWLRGEQLTLQGDWSETHPQLRAGGWAFQFKNDWYPDLDDTAVCAWAMHRFDRERHAQPIERAADWLAGMQSRNGGFASFDADNDQLWMNRIPFADHGALLDPPTSDVSARVLTLLARLNRPQDDNARQRVMDFLRREQTEDGAWFGRWGTNYIYGTWSALTALAAAGMSNDAREIRRAVAWLKSRQREDGGWGETNDSYFDPALAGRDTRSSATQTAWAVLALVAAGDADSLEAAHGVSWLLCHQHPDGRWYDAGFNAPGFPRVFYLKYHGYDLYFPYWALASYRNAREHG